MMLLDFWCKSLVYFVSSIFQRNNKTGIYVNVLFSTFT